MKTPTRLPFIFCLLVAVCTFSAAFAVGQEEQDSPQFASVEERRVFALMEQEREDLQQARKDLDLREKELKSLEASVDKKLVEIENKLTELKNLQKNIETLLAEKSAKEAKRIKNLSLIYEKMAPGRAALAMSGMRPELATELLANMKPKAAAKILDMLKKQKTSELSTVFTTLQIE